MFRVRTRSESTSSRTALRGTIGSASVWDAQRRARGLDSPRAEPEAVPAPLVVAPAELAALVQGIVQVTLDTRLPGCPAEERRTLARTLEARLLELFGLSTARKTEPLLEPISPAPMRTEAVVVAPPPAASPAAPRAPASPRVRALELILDSKLQGLGGTLAERPELRARLVELALEQLTGVANDASATRDELQSLDVLQRRAAKLERSLHETRAALAYVSGLERVDEGIASIYRTVQGLALNDPRQEQKREALEHVFRANLALQKPDDPTASSG